MNVDHPDIEMMDVNDSPMGGTQVGALVDDDEEETTGEEEIEEEIVKDEQEHNEPVYFQEKEEPPRVFEVGFTPPKTKPGMCV